MTNKWIPWAERKPEHCSRILIHRSVAGQSYVDALAYHEEPDTGMKPLADTKHITHWMPMPDAPVEYALTASRPAIPHRVRAGHDSGTTRAIPGRRR